MHICIYVYRCIHIYTYMIYTPHIIYTPYIYIYIHIHIDMHTLQRPHCNVTGMMINKEDYAQMTLYQVSE